MSLSPYSSSPHRSWDIIGDVHGRFALLHALIRALGYRLDSDGLPVHPEGRKLLFIGDLLDRGPENLRTVDWVMAMTDAGLAVSLMGNHEFNALTYHLSDGHGGWLRAHTPVHTRQHQAVLDELEAPHAWLAARGVSTERFWAEVLAWLRRRPPAFETPTQRMVHACWHEPSVAKLCHIFEASQGEWTDTFLAAAAGESWTPERKAYSICMKGPEIPVPFTFLDKQGTPRDTARIKWWQPVGQASRYRDVIAKVEKIRGEAARARLDDPVDERFIAHANAFAYDGVPVAIGHYQLKGDRPRRLSKHVVGTDYEDATDAGRLVAFRTEHERPWVWVDGHDPSQAFDAELDS